MRREELTTVNLAHNAARLLESKSLNLNCDGTTLYQKKLQGAAINGTVLSVNEIPDGSADSMIADMSHEFRNLGTLPTNCICPMQTKLTGPLSDHPHQI